MQPKPGRIRKLVDIDVAHPREHEDNRRKTRIEDVRRQILERPVD